MKYLLVDLGGTKCRATLRDENNQPLVKPHYNTVPVKNVLESIKKAMTPYNSYIDKDTVIKIAVPGLVKNNKIIQLPNLKIKEWDLVKELKRLYHNKILLYNDLEAAWHGEYKKKNFLLIYASTGVGGALNGENIEFGRRTTINTKGEIKYRNVETTLSKEDLKQDEFIIEHLTGGLALGRIAMIKGIELGVNINEYGKELDNYAQNNKKAKEVFQEAGSILGKAIKSYADKNKITNIVIGGSLGTNTHYFNAIKKECPNAKKTKFLNSSEAIFQGLLKI